MRGKTGSSTWRSPLRVVWGSPTRIRLTTNRSMCSLCRNLFLLSLILRRHHVDVVQRQVAVVHRGTNPVADLDCLEDVGVVHFVRHGHGIHETLDLAMVPRQPVSLHALHLAFERVRFSLGLLC